jgi:hypothetical protein
MLETTGSDNGFQHTQGFVIKVHQLLTHLAAHPYAEFALSSFSSPLRGKVWYAFA